MEPIQLFQLAARQAHWLSVRQDVVAGNVANANTPGYKTMDVEPFSSVLAKAGTGTHMVADNPAHFTEDPLRNSIKTIEDNDNVGMTPSGNDVSMAQELMKSGDIQREFQLNTGLVKSFHQMMMMVVKS